MSGYSKRFDAAVALAVDRFRAIARKGSEVPYITHLFAVTALVGEFGGDEDQLVAAVLHDILEDVEDIGEDLLRARFGERVARIVRQCTDTEQIPKPAWRPRKERHLALVPGLPADTKLVMCADKLHNCSTLIRDVRAEGLSTFARFSGKREGTLWYYRSMAEALGTGWEHPLLAAYEAVVDELEAVSAPSA